MKKIFLPLILLFILSCESEDTPIQPQQIEQVEQENQTCDKPTNMFVQNILGNSATITWDNTDPALLVEIEYGVSGFTQGSGTIVSNISAPYVLINLTSSTDYDFYLRTICTSINSDWTDVSSFQTICDGGTYTGSIILNTQQEVDDFSTNCYSKIDGDLTLGNNGFTSISQTYNLSTLIEITGSLTIQFFAPDYNGYSFSNLSTIGQNLIIQNNSNGGTSNNVFPSLGLDNLNTVGNDLIVRNNDNIESLYGLENIISIGNDLIISDNSNITSISNLNYLGSIGNDFKIENNTITHINQFYNLESIGGDFRVDNNNQLIYVTSVLDNINTINGSIVFSYNDSLQTINTTPTTNTLYGLFIGTNPQLTSINFSLFLTATSQITFIKLSGLDIKPVLFFKSAPATLK